MPAEEYEFQNFIRSFVGKCIIIFMSTFIILSCVYVFVSLAPHPST